ncbi:hypothetical protein Pla110_39850 [Polystyrenella longa]|uniref:Alpha glucuronidase N-terminal domain-containing protein n=1 Tax=Polystyrenella longa TaxID=2528007 RepID=A0A518CSN8_9PLAN|nr:alpha-glucuronidase family glycosyl hydrolase [Polystyrenella longa]QDU82230.1 hypothetical protein Pla110_39850 [Polystyrenella longa]
MTLLSRRFVAMLLVLLIPGSLYAVEKGATEKVTVHLVTGTEATKPMEKMAAMELESQLKELFNVEVTQEEVLSSDTEPFIILGSATNKSLFGTDSDYSLPKLSPQGHALKSLEQDSNTGLTIAGGSPVATLWAVYEFGYQNGIRYLMQSDVYPATPRELKLSGYDITLEPNLKKRTFRLVDQFPNSFESWNAAECDLLIKQLGKLKFNHIDLNVSPWHPFIHYELDGVAKETGVMHYGKQFLINPDYPGSTAFGGQDQFENSDFAGMETYKERNEAGKRYIQSILKSAHDQGMTVGVSLDPLAFTPEFKQVLPSSFVRTDHHNLHLGANNPYSGPKFEQLAKTQIEAWLDTYPELDEMSISLFQGSATDEEVEEGFAQLQSYSSKLKESTLEDVLEKSKSNSISALRDSGQTAASRCIASLAFYNRLFRSGALAERKELPQLQFSDVTPVLYPYLPEILPGENSSLAVSVTAGHGVHQFDQVPAQLVPAVLDCYLHNQNLSVMAQSTTQWLAERIQQLQTNEWEGVSVHFWTPAEQDPTLHFLSRVTFNSSITPRQAHDQYFETITRDESATGRMWLAFENMEAGSRMLDDADIHFVSPYEGDKMLMKHYNAEKPLPENWEEIKEHFTQNMIELYRSHDAVKTAGRKELYYYAKRSEAVLTYLTAVEELHAAAAAREEDDLETASEHLYTALESLYDAIDTLNDVARNPSDLGTIVLLNEYGYGPLLKEVGTVDAQLDAAE